MVTWPAFWSPDSDTSRICLRDAASMIVRPPVPRLDVTIHFPSGLAATRIGTPPVLISANRSNVSVYAFDARGLRVRSPSEETKLALDLARETAFSGQISGAMTTVGQAL